MTTKKRTQKKATTPKSTRKGPEQVPDRPAVVPVLPEVLYTKHDAMTLTGWKKAAWLSALNKGLKTSQVHGRTYVLGKRLIEYIAGFEK